MCLPGEFRVLCLSQFGSQGDVWLKHSKPVFRSPETVSPFLLRVKRKAREDTLTEGVGVVTWGGKGGDGGTEQGDSPETRLTWHIHEFRVMQRLEGGVWC